MTASATRKGIFFAVCLLAATTALGGEPCTSARRTFAKVAEGYACNEEIADAARLDCVKDPEDMQRLWELTELCTTRSLQSPDVHLRLAKIRKERSSIEQKLEPLLADRLSVHWLVPGILSLSAGAGLLLATFGGTLGSSGSLISFGGSGNFQTFFNPLTPLTKGLLVGGIAAVFFGLAAMIYVLSQRDPYTDQIKPLQKQLEELNGANEAEEDTERNLERIRSAARVAPEATNRLPPPPPLSIAFTLARF